MSGKSSTRVSIDSESEYQAHLDPSGSGNGSLNGNQSAKALSRSSSVSLLSTTATKDGVEGKRIHRFHDPTSYMVPPPRSISPSEKSDASDVSGISFSGLNNSGPPISLNEKIQLLRTGMVSGAPHSPGSPPQPSASAQPLPAAPTESSPRRHGH